MAQPNQLIITLASGGSLRGHVQLADGSQQPFVGWLALLSALERAVARANTSAPNSVDDRENP